MRRCAGAPCGVLGFYGETFADEAVDEESQLTLIKSLAPYALEIELLIHHKIQEADYRYQP